MKPIKFARIIRERLNAITSVMSDEVAIENKVLFKQWSGDGVFYEIGERILYDDVLYRVIQSHTSQMNWTPDVAVSLFAKVLIPDPEVIPEWERPDSTNAYMKGDKVKYKEKVYESLIDNNIWSPEEYPAGWKEVAE